MMLRVLNHADGIPQPRFSQKEAATQDGLFALDFVEKPAAGKVLEPARRIRLLQYS